MFVHGSSQADLCLQIWNTFDLHFGNKFAVFMPSFEAKCPLLLVRRSYFCKDLGLFCAILVDYYASLCPPSIFEQYLVDAAIPLLLFIIKSSA